MRLCGDIRNGADVRPLSTFELVQLLMARFGAQDAQGFALLFAPDVQWRAPDPTTGAWESSRRSRREVESFLLAVFGAFELTAVTVRRLLVDGEDALVLGQVRWRARATMAVGEADFMLSVSVHRGLVDECWLMQETIARHRPGAVRTR